MPRRIDEFEPLGDPLQQRPATRGIEPTDGTPFQRKFFWRLILLRYLGSLCTDLNRDHVKSGLRHSLFCFLFCDPPKSSAHSRESSQGPGPPHAIFGKPRHRGNGWLGLDDCDDTVDVTRAAAVRVVLPGNVIAERDPSPSGMKIDRMIGLGVGRPRSQDAVVALPRSPRGWRDWMRSFPLHEMPFAASRPADGGSR